jgi:hypothetical protein
LLPTVVEGRGEGALLVAETGAAAAPEAPRTPIQWGAVALEAWHRAQALVPAAMPLMWARPDRVPRPTVRPMRGLPEIKHVDGTSVGLPLALLLAAATTGLLVPAHLAAPGALGPHGDLEEVAGLREKIKAIQVLAPYVRVLLVPEVQAGAGQTINAELGAGLQIVGVATLEQAIEYALGDAIRARFAALGAERAERARLVARQLALSIDPHGPRAFWPPLAKAAAFARQRWTELDDGQRASLALAQSVAERHVPADARPPLVVPDEATLARIPVDARTLIRAHLLQQSGDLGLPPTAEALALADGQFATGADAWPEQVVLAGAVGRLLGVSGAPAAGLALALAAAQTWANRNRPDDLAFPLCEVYRLAAALDDDEAFARAEVWFVAHVAAAPAGISPFLALARGQAAVLRGEKGHIPGAAAMEALTSAFEGRAATERVVGSAARWRLRRALRLSETLPGTDLELLAKFPVQAALHALDRALFAGEDTAPAMAALIALREDAQALHGLLDAGLNPADIARFYPY